MKHKTVSIFNIVAYDSEGDKVYEIPICGHPIIGAISNMNGVK